MPNILALLLLFAQKPPSVTLAAPVDPVVAAKTHDQLAANLSPSAKSKLATVVTSLRTSASVTDAVARTAVNAAFPNLSDGDTQALMFMAMMEASNEAQQDLKNIASEVDKMNAQKSALGSKLGTAGAHSASIAKVVVQSNPVDYYRAPDPLPADASAAEMQKRLHDLDGMAIANERWIKRLTNQQLQMKSLISNTFKAAQSVTPSVLRSLN